jgi:hypothetical protein
MIILNKYIVIIKLEFKIKILQVNPIKKINFSFSFPFFSPIFLLFENFNVTAKRHLRDAKGRSRHSDSLSHSRRLVPNLSPMHAMSSKKKTQTSSSAGDA